MAAAILVQTVQQLSDLSIHKRAEESAADRRLRDDSKLPQFAIKSGCCRRHKQGERDSSFGQSLSLSRSRTKDTQSRRLYVSDRPTSGRPTGEMGAAIAALGTTIEPQTKGAQSHARNMRTNLDDEFVITDPPSVTIRSENEFITTKNNRPLKFQETYVSTETGTRIISRPISEPDSIYSLRPGESMANMRRRVDDELHEAVSSYPIFQNSQPKHPSPIESSPSRTTRLTLMSRFNEDEEVGRQVASSPVFQQNSEARESMMTRIREDEALRERDTMRDEKLRRQVAILPRFRNSVAYSPTRRPELVASGFMTSTPLPAYEHAALPYDGVGESIGVQGGEDHVLRNQEDLVRDEENNGFSPANLPPDYVR